MAAAPFAGLFLIFFAVLAALLPNAMILISGAIVASVARGSPSSSLAALVGLLTLLYFLRQGVEAARTALSTVVGRHVQQAVEGTILRSAEHTEFAQLELETKQGELARARGHGLGWLSPADAIGPATSLLGNRLRSTGAAIILGMSLLWVPAIVIPAWLISRAWLLREVNDLMTKRAELSEEIRRSSYFRAVSLKPRDAKEVKLFRLSPWLLEKFSDWWLKGMTSAWIQRRNHRKMMLLSGLLLTAAYAIALVMILGISRQAAIPAAEFVVLAQAALSLSGFGFSGDDEWRFRQATSSLPTVFALGRPDRPAALNHFPSPMSTVKEAPQVSLSDIWFQYDNADRPTLKGLSLQIPSAGSVAIVGRNGAGKTTIAKLLAGLYVPTHGQISWMNSKGSAGQERSRSSVSVAFQDFVRYEVSLAENISLDENWRHHSLLLEECLSIVDATDLLRRLEWGWETILSRQYEKGTDLSGGQWQKIALARALFRAKLGNSLLILDEPTASLDVESELKLFSRIVDFVRESAVLLISHRFSTVRQAKTIHVLDNGIIIESGSHNALIDQDGEYARMFSVQAEAYKE